MRTIPDMHNKVAIARNLAGSMLVDFNMRGEVSAEHSDWPRLHVTIQPRGFWSRDAIRLTFDVRQRDEPSLSWSSGGRDTEEVSSDLHAAQNMAGALVLASHIGAAWKRLFLTTEGA